MNGKFYKIDNKEFYHGIIGLSGTQQISTEYDSCIITHTFVIKKLFKNINEQECLYEIENHIVNTDNTKALEAKIQKQEDAILELANMIAELKAAQND